MKELGRSRECLEQLWAELFEKAVFMSQYRPLKDDKAKLQPEQSRPVMPDPRNPLLGQF
jgi:hypothetical protein